ncbi:hypothetical protein CDV36_012986 [Fusarium kuroshium]|uniref:Uncharacterized protein n=1 Tax=Fusarium kuroshium TaxID=2010991 RepID=A0A3M2RQD4_9HYPO|nr:hypothetical protein CDV36_012986 [Fusarium kuroshium]
MSILENDGRICLPATDFVDYSHVDLDMARAFLVDFGLTMVEDRGHEVYFGGYGAEPSISYMSLAVGLRSRSASKARTHHLLRLPPTATPDKPDPSTAKSSGCTLMKPPDCTRTVSFISVGSGYSSTVFGECSYAMSCATGKQSTTTTVIDVQGQADNTFDNPEEEWADESGDSDQSSFDFFETWCDELGISFDSINNVKAECEGDEAQMNSIRLARAILDFCSELNRDKDKELFIEIHSGGREEQKRPIAESIRQCAISYPFSVPEKGKVDAGCGTYSYKIMPFTKPTPTSSKPAEPSKTDYTGPSEG